MKEVFFKTTRLAGTPVFVASGTDMRLSQVYGATRFKDDPLWYYPAFYPLHKRVLSDLRALHMTPVFSDTAKQRVKTLEDYDRCIEQKTLPAGFEFRTQPYQHQLDGLIHLLYFLRAALFYACGLGKTKVVVDWQRATGAWPLILCPRVVLRVWSAEAMKHGIEQEYRIIDATSKKGKLKQISEAKHYSGAVISYDSARLYYEDLMAEIPYTALVGDESHYIKNGMSARTKAALELSKRAYRRVIMSGTPSLGDPRDMYSQLRFLSPVLAAEPFWKFRQIFCKFAPHHKHIVIGFKNLDVLQQRVSTVAIRRKKDECLDLPERTIIDVAVRLKDKQRRLYNTLYATSGLDELTDQLVRENHLLLDEGVLRMPNVAVMINKLIQVTCGFVYKQDDGPNICDGCMFVRNCVVEGVKPYTKRCHVDQTPRPAIVEMLKENAKKETLTSKLEEILVDPENKVIIWGQFTPELDLIEDAIRGLWNKKDHDINWVDGQDMPYHVRVDGKAKRVNELVDKFNNDPACRVYVSQVATGTGITLNAANYMIYNSLPWKLGDYEQSIDRNHRVGQDRKLTVFRLLGSGTVDWDIAKALRLKTTVSETITSVIVCSACDQKEGCEAKIFGEGCKYKRSVSRPVTKVHEI